MAITTVKQGNDGAWQNARAVPTGHFAAYLPGPRILHLYDPAGTKIAETGVPEGVRDFSPYIDRASGEIVVLFSSFNNDQSPWPWKRWTTGAFVGATAPPPPPAGNNAQLVAQIKALADQIV